MDRRNFIKNVGKAGLAIALSPYLKACGTYEEVKPVQYIPQKSGVVLKRPIDGLINIEATKKLLIENPQIYEPNELILDLINESYFSFFNSEIPEIITLDYNTIEEIRRVTGTGATGYYEPSTKTIHIMEGDYAVEDINRLFHELGHNIERENANEDIKEHLAQSIEFALGLEGLLLFQKLTEIEPEKDLFPNYNPFLYNLPNTNANVLIDYNQFGTDDYINGDATLILKLKNNNGNLTKTMEEILKTTVYAMDKESIDFLKQDQAVRKEFVNEAFKLLIENSISPKIPYDQENNEYFNKIIKRFNRILSYDYLNPENGYFMQFLR